jgi:Skp family chaperone for outer membrane proteins
LTIRAFITFIVIIFSSCSFATNIRVLDFQKIIENNINISLFNEKINNDQEFHKDTFKNEELILQNELARIEKLELILDASELEKEIENYNKKLIDFNDKVEKFNLHYEMQINNFKNKIVSIILQELEKYSEENKIDLVLDSKNYVLSSNSINITNIIENMVKKKKIEISFEKY